MCGRFEWVGGSVRVAVAADADHTLLNYESTAELYVSIVASAITATSLQSSGANGSSSSSSLEAAALLVVALIDVNDCRPVFAQRQFVAVIDENSAVFSQPANVTVGRRLAHRVVKVTQGRIPKLKQCLFNYWNLVRGEIRIV